MFSFCIPNINTLGFFLNRTVHQLSYKFNSSANKMGFNNKIYGYHNLKPTPTLKQNNNTDIYST